MMPKYYDDICDPECPHIKIYNGEAFYATCSLLNKELNFYDGVFLQENICYILAWGQEVIQHKRGNNGSN